MHVLSIGNIFFSELITYKKIPDTDLQTYGLQTVYDSLQTYLNAWTKTNQTISNEYILKYKYFPRVSVLYSHETNISICLTTKGMSWQDLQRWTMQNCSVNDTNILVLDMHSPAAITMDDYPYKVL